MAGSFAQTMRALDAERARGGWVAVALIAGVAAAWLLWVLFARIPIYQASVRARLEVVPAPSQVGAPIGGRVVAVALVVGKRVAIGDMLVALDPAALPVELERARGQLAARVPEIASLDRELAAEATTITAGDVAGRAAVRAQLARARAADIDLVHAETELARVDKLAVAGVAATAEVDQARADLAQKRGAREALGHATDGLVAAEQERDAGRRARTAELERQRAAIEGTIGGARAELARLELELERHTIRAPVAGVLGSVATLSPGATVAVGASIATVIPAGELHVLAEFPPSAIGWLARDQPARLALDGFPWTRWGTVPARVARVAMEVQRGAIRVELTVAPGTHVPLTNGMTGSVEVEVERVSPATLVLRSLVDAPKDAPAP
jgi:membrane fusion protein (multidrug efflux system)